MKGTTMNFNILIADDDPIIRDLLSDIVKKEGYTSIQASNGMEAIDIFFTRTDIDLIILDVMMPKYDGWEVLKEIREFSNVPIIMLTALGDERHELLGLEKGADDYISKPFSYEIFVARMNKQIRKIRKDSLEEINIGEIKINQEAHKVYVSNSEIEINKKEYQLLCYFIKNNNRVLTRDQILERVWGYEFDGDIRTIDTHIKMLRAKLLSASGYLKTIRGTGYMFEVDKDENH